jgi:hypothetical protein
MSIDASNNQYAMPSSTILSAPANGFWAGPTSGSNAAPIYRAIVGADLAVNAAANLAAIGGTTLTAVLANTSPFTAVQTINNNLNITSGYLSVGGTPTFAQAGDLSISRVGGVAGAIFFGTGGGVYLYSDGTNFSFTNNVISPSMTISGSTFSFNGHTCSIVSTVITCP